MFNFTHSKNKFSDVYVLTPRGIAEKATLTVHFLKRKNEEYESLRIETEALQSEINSGEQGSMQELST
jgi:hypothetical protein